MGFDRRLLTRYAFALSGEVVWGKAKRFSSKLIPTRSKMTTADLSLGGLCVRVHEPTELQSGSTCIVSPASWISTVSSCSTRNAVSDRIA